MKQKNCIWAVAATMLLAAASFTSCYKQDNVIYPEPETAPDYSFDEGSLIINGQCESNDVSNFFVQVGEGGAATNGAIPATIKWDEETPQNHCVIVDIRSEAEARAAGNAAIQVQWWAGNKEVFAAHDTQFFISFGEENALNNNDQIRVTMSIKADNAFTAGTGAHAAPGSWLSGAFGNVEFTEEWTEFDSGWVTVSDNGPKAGAYSIAFDLANGEANRAFFDNIRVEVIRYKPTFKQIEGGIGNLKVPATYENIGAWGGTWSGNSLENEQDWSEYEYVWVKYSGLVGNINFGVMYSEWKAHQSWGEQFEDKTVALSGTEGIVGIKLENEKTYVKGNAETDGQYKGDVYSKHIREIFIQATSGGSSVTLEEIWVGSKADFDKATGADKLTWTEIFSNDGTDASKFSVKYFKNYTAAQSVDGAIVVESLDPEKTYTEYYNGGGDAKLANDWDTQFLISLPEPLKKGTQVKLTLKYKADKEANTQTQGHMVAPEPGAIEGQNGYNGTYIGNLGLGDVKFTTSWQTMTEQEFVIESEGTQSICFNLEVLREKNKYYFDDIKVSVLK